MLLVSRFIKPIVVNVLLKLCVSAAMSLNELKLSQVDSVSSNAPQMCLDK